MDPDRLTFTVNLTVPADGPPGAYSLGALCIADVEYELAFAPHDTPAAHAV